MVTDATVRVRLGSIDLELPPPLDAPWRELLAQPVNLRTASHPSSDWVFNGQSPGRPINPSHIATHLRDVFSARAARLGPCTNSANSARPDHRGSTGLLPRNDRSAPHRLRLHLRATHRRDQGYTPGVFLAGSRTGQAIWLVYIEVCLDSIICAGRSGSYSRLTFGFPY